MPTLYAIGEDLLALDALLEERDGDITDPDVAAAIDAWAAELTANLAVKLDSCVGYIRTLEMEEAAAKAEAEQWQHKAASRAKRRDLFKARVKSILEATGQTKVTTATGRVVAVQANGGNPPVIYADPLDPAKVPDEYCIVRRTIDNAAVLAALKEGETLPFAHLGERGSHLRIR